MIYSGCAADVDELARYVDHHTPTDCQQFQLVLCEAEPYITGSVYAQFSPAQRLLFTPYLLALVTQPVLIKFLH